MPAYDQAVRGLVFGADAPGGRREARRHGADARRHRRPQGRRRLPPPHRARARRSGSATRAGRTTARSSRAPASRSTLPVLRRRDEGPRLRRACSPPCAKMPAGDVVVLHACCHNPTGVDLDAPSSGPQSARSSRGAGSCRSSTWPTRASPTASTPTRRRCARSRRDASPGLRVELVLEVVLALRRARRRAQHRRRERRRGGAGAQPAEAPRPHQLLEPADARRRRWSRPC